MKKKALITGIAGQDGSYLAEFLLQKGYEVYGIVRTGKTDLSRIESIEKQLRLESGDVLDMAEMVRIVKAIRPDEIYNLAARSFIPLSWSAPMLTGDVTAMGVTCMLEALRVSAPKARFFQAASSEIFGNAPVSPQNETTAFNPRTPYGVSKLYGFFMTANYRERYNLYCCSGILYNHESPRRGLEFVTRKVTNGVARISLGLQDKLVMGSLDTRRDWGFAGDYVEGLWKQIQQSQAKDYVFATGVTHSVQELVEFAFSSVGLNWKDHVEVDSKFVRGLEQTILCGDASRAKNDLQWEPKVGFSELIEMMIKNDLEFCRSERVKKAAA